MKREFVSSLTSDRNELRLIIFFIIPLLAYYDSKYITIIRSLRDQIDFTINKSVSPSILNYYSEVPEVSKVNLKYHLNES